MIVASLPDILNQLERHHGMQEPGFPTEPFAMVLWEIVGYLADDEKRSAAFKSLRRLTALNANQILKTPLASLQKVTAMGGIHADLRAHRLLESARLVVDDFGGDLPAVLREPASKARKSLMRFPMIGEPGAEKILLFCGADAVLALESNGLRTLVRLGFGEDRKNYAATYRAVREAVRDELPAEQDTLMRAHLLLRRHGQSLCLRAAPLCQSCPVRESCPSGRN